MTKNKGPKDKRVGAGGKNKNKKAANEDKREYTYKHHDHGDKHFHDKAHAVKPIVCKESKDDKIGAELLHFMEDEKKNRHDHHHHHHQAHPAHHPSLAAVH